mmetsp:Transcript_117965/g.328725  ORF Transcript_117965/g.328725 Transcript_117965/m.328725 type:complete len:252 (+) Transcript_117965:562-1317(+)
MHVEFCCKHLSIHERVPHQEWRAKTSRECCLWLGHAFLCACDLGSVARNEVVHDLVFGELRHGWQHSKGVASEEDYLFGMVLDLCWDPCVWNELEWVCDTSVLSDGNIVEVDDTCSLVEDDVLQNRAEADRIVDFRLLLLREADALRIAAPLNVEDAPRVPHVLIVADELALRVSAQCCLACAAEPEEERDVVALAICGRVEWQSPLRRWQVPLRHQGHQIVHDREDTFLHLASILRAQDHHLPSLEGNGN